MVGRVAAEDTAALLAVGVTQREPVALRRLRGVTSLLTRVQNSFLWESYGGTLRLLRRWNEEGPVFTAFTGVHHNARTSGISQPERIGVFERWFAAYVAERPGEDWRWIEDVFAHERAVRRLMLHAQTLDADATTPPDGRRGKPVPYALRPIAPVRLYHDPTNVRTAVPSERPGDAGDSISSPFVYVAPEPAVLRAFEIDDLTFAVLELIDGSRDVPAIAATLRDDGEDFATDAIRDTVEALVEAGVLALRE